MTGEIFEQLIGLAIGSAVAYPIARWAAKRHSRFYAEPSIALVGGIINTYIIVFLVVFPTTLVARNVEFSEYREISNISVVIMIGMILGMLMNTAIHIGAHLRVPMVGRNLNAYFLALARANLATAEKRMRRLEEFDTQVAKA